MCFGQRGCARGLATLLSVTRTNAESPKFVGSSWCLLSRGAVFIAVDEPLRGFLTPPPFGVRRNVVAGPHLHSPLLVYVVWATLILWYGYFCYLHFCPLKLHPRLTGQAVMGIDAAYEFFQIRRMMTRWVAHGCLTVGIRTQTTSHRLSQPASKLTSRAYWRLRIWWSIECDSRNMRNMLFDLSPIH